MKLMSQEFEAIGVQMRFNCDYVDIPIEEPIDEDIIIDYDEINKEVPKKETKEVPKKEPKELKKEPKESKKNDYEKLKKPELIELVKTLYPTMKSLAIKNKDELISLIKAKEPKEEPEKKPEEPEKKPEEPKKKEGKGKTKEDLRKEIKDKYPDYPLKVLLSKDELLEILNKTPEEIAEIILKKQKRKQKGGYSSDSDIDEFYMSGGSDEETSYYGFHMN